MDQFIIVVLLLVQFLSLGITTGQNSYVVMEYVLQWKSTFCITNNCKPNVRSIFYIHGLWPTNAAGHSIKCPCPNRSKEDYNVKKLMNKDKKLATDLNAIWPNLKIGESNLKFWRHEWKKHGLCSSAAHPVKAYFKAAVMVHDNLIAINNNNNLRDYLYQGGVRPSATNTYTKQVIIKAVQRLVGANNNVYISCMRDYLGRYFLKEIYLCLDTTLQNFISCPTANQSQRNCGGLGSQIRIPL